MNNQQSAMSSQWDLSDFHPFVEETLKQWALLNTGMNGRFPNCYKPSMVSFVTSSEKLIHTVNQQRQQWLVPEVAIAIVLISITTR